MFRILALILAFGTAPTGATAQLTDVSCDDTARLTQTLKQNLGAERHGMGLRDPETDRKSGGEGKSVDLGGRRLIKKKKTLCS